jgi:ferrochelatase
VTSHSRSYSSCRQYLENIADAQKEVGPGAPQVDKIRVFYNHPLFIEANVTQVRTALEKFPEPQRASAHIVFTAHSIPEAMAQNSDYQMQLEETARLIAETLELGQWHLIFQSRSGSPMQPWLGPDIGDYLRELTASGIEQVVLAPIGFVSDHMEIIYDLDTEAMALCRELGLKMIRAATVGTHPAFVKMIRELILERLEPNRERRFLGHNGPAQDICSANCCALDG